MDWFSVFFLVKIHFIFVSFILWTKFFSVFLDSHYKSISGRLTKPRHSRLHVTNFPSFFHFLVNLARPRLTRDLIASNSGSNNGVVGASNLFQIEVFSIAGWVTTCRKLMMSFWHLGLSSLLGLNRGCTQRWLSCLFLLSSLISLTMEEDKSSSRAFSR